MCCIYNYGVNFASAFLVCGIHDVNGKLYSPQRLQLLKIHVAYIII